jgi:hypothetical protein
VIKTLIQLAARSAVQPEWDRWHGRRDELDRGGTGGGISWTGGGRERWGFEAAVASDRDPFSRSAVSAPPADADVATFKVPSAVTVEAEAKAGRGADGERSRHRRHRRRADAATAACWRSLAYPARNVL